MMGELFSVLTNAVEGTPAIAMIAAMIWGMLSILLSPCHLASIPLIIGFIDDQGKTSTARALGISTLFSVGILVTIAAIGAITAAAGRMMGDLGAYANYVVALIFFYVGLGLLGVVPLSWNRPEQVGKKRKGLLAAFMLGLIFGIALGPCSFAYMAPLLGITFKLGAAQPVYAGSLLLMYGIGHCGVIALAGMSSGWVQKYKAWNQESRGAFKLKKVCGLLVLLGGLYLIYTAP
ncbi:cytochrome c biogenesis CcdA family protein [Pontiella agarivorans]|nr:cytochrome c biogenesis protein CcdA [Pontiella agarivorans]